MKPVNDTQWVNHSHPREVGSRSEANIASRPARGARSVWSECQSRVIESRKFANRLGLPVCARGDSTVLHPVSRFRRGAQAKCSGAGPGSENGAKTHGGILESWESRTDPSDYRKRTTPGSQRPGAWAVLSAVWASETRKATRDSGSEGNRSERGNGGGSLSGLIVALESRRTEAGGSL
jgi:hypothetical protein